eukprot:comp14410_c0_seq1/m.10513 comp14410_c0_seq1/g.10513  ORF comp14410_c0_seq1/g.10513 comp14410_c0_seq1/m.10513 type:complete len:212 (-) comp14410_c0_seq1:60-695(-)
MSSGWSIVLGSASVFRRQLMNTLGMQFTVASPDIDEKAITAGYDERKRANPDALSLAIAHAKADALLPLYKGTRTLIVTGDQVAVFRGEIREKPKDAEECRKYVRDYSSGSDPCSTCAAIVVTNGITGIRAAGTDYAHQYLHEVPDEIVGKLIENGEIMGCCGALTVTDPDILPYVGRLDGTKDSLMGLPLDLLCRLLSEAAGEVVVERVR